MKQRLDAVQRDAERTTSPATRKPTSKPAINWSARESAGQESRSETDPAPLNQHATHRFTRDAAARIAKQFKIVGKEDVLFDLVIRTTKSYERYRKMPDYHQAKDALEKLIRAIDETASIVAKHQRVLELSLHGTLLKLLGELLTYDGIEKLLGSDIVRDAGTDRQGQR